MTAESHSAAEIPSRLDQVREDIRLACRAAARPADAVKLVAVSKTMPAAAVEQAIEAGQRVFGENRVQEAYGKWPALKDLHPGLELHLIGPLQTNKVKEAVALFDVIETVDRPKLARALAEEMERVGRRPRCFVQVNTGEEPQKAGIAPDEAAEFVALCRETFGLPVVGLMCIPPLDEEPAMHFALLAKLAKESGLDELSMGMSGDFETAIAFGATYVRVGTAIFGARVLLE
ncbi:alanine racemase [Methyloceanibacter methanicus]|uniref:Pyridoxal phosphate homeostasis protein n=1 Tax=Methyloceanibacter methanicus TaxID=1774968 RepID=A0A1E3W5S8_9HYPH|nr:YggS family pyridoxal phosphate-dependent enzyme [Methyloceanibacter methanicus]ODS01159.1 alanine racemase [Methyloceanibacter methanicus]